MTEKKKRNVRKRDYVIQREEQIKLIRGVKEATGEEVLEDATAWIDIESGCKDTAEAVRKIKNDGKVGKFRVIAICEQGEVKTEQVTQTVFV